MNRRHVLYLGLAGLCACTGSGPVALAPDTTLVMVRHADRIGDDLSDLGRARAQALVPALADVPLDAIYSPGIQRNLDTAAPLSAARNLPVTRRAGENAAPRLARDSAGRSVIWIGNKGNIIPIWADLGLPGPPPLDYGDLHIVRVDAAGRVQVERRRFEPQ